MRITAILFLSLFILAGCNDDTGTLTGRVTDDYGEPVSGGFRHAWPHAPGADTASTARNQPTCHRERFIATSAAT